MKLQSGDSIVCNGIKATISEIVSQEFYEGYGHGSLADEWIIEFIDTDGVYRSWHSGVDGGTIERKVEEKIMKKISINLVVEVWEDINVKDFIQVHVVDRFNVFADDVKWGVVFDTPPTEEDINKQNVRYLGYDIVWNQYMNGGEYQIYDVNSDHTEYHAEFLIDNAIKYIEHNAKVKMLVEKYQTDYDFSDTAMYMMEAIPETTTNTIEEIYEKEYGHEVPEELYDGDIYEDAEYSVINDAFWLMIRGSIN